MFGFFVEEGRNNEELTAYLSSFGVFDSGENVRRSRRATETLFQSAENSSKLSKFVETHANGRGFIYESF
jgi:hypothetical protein